MSLNIPRNIAKHSGECSRQCWQTFQGISPNIPGNVLKHSRKFCQTFQGMLPIFGVNEEITGQIRIQNPVKHPQWSPSAKITIGLNTLTISAKKPTADVRLYSKCTSDRMCCKCGVWVDCKCMEFVAAGWCTRKQLRLNQTKRNVLLW